MVNLSSFILFHAQRTPDRVALIYEGEHISYAELSDRILSLAGFLIEKNIEPGQVVAVFMKNSSAFLELAFAVSHIGAVFLPINYRLAYDEAKYILENSDSKLLFADEEFASSIESIVPTTLLDAEAQANTQLISEGSLKPPAMPRDPDDLFRLMYTSGTTSRPKGVMHTYSNWYWKCWDHIAALDMNARDRLLVVGPLYHVGAFDCGGIAVLIMGGAIYILRNFDPEAVLQAIDNERLTCAWMAPVMLGRILAFEDSKHFDLSSFAWCIGGGEKTPENRIRRFGQLFKNGRYVDAYGLSETCGGDTLMERGQEIAKIGSAGRAVAHVSIKICDAQGNALPAGSEGEICLRGPKIMRSYWKDTERTRESFFEDWFRSGDVGYLDDDGFLYLTDRIKDMIKSGGENIASSEVERVILQIPEVADVAVVGLPDDNWGERPVAVVEVLNNSRLSFDDLTQYCSQHLAAFKVPKELFVVDSLPRNPSGKVLKRVLRDNLANNLKQSQHAE